MRSSGAIKRRDEGIQTPFVTSFRQLIGQKSVCCFAASFVFVVCVLRFLKRELLGRLCHSEETMSAIRVHYLQIAFVQ